VSPDDYCAKWPPPARRRPLAVAIPGSVLSVEHGLAAKTFKAGVIARALAVYRVTDVLVYRDSETLRGDDSLLALLLSYAETPPHLRKRLFPLKPQLRYAGLLPPLRTPSHEAPLEPVEGALVEGVVEKAAGGDCTVYLGVLGRWRVRGCKARPGSRVTVRLESPREKRAAIVSWAGVYSGYRVLRVASLADAVEWARRRGLVVIATSRRGACPLRGVLCGIVGEARRRGALVALGGPHASLSESPLPFDALLNTIPLQGALTVRTEEALQATLSLINTLLEGDWC
jgi:predicted SPOUT superfamily RNA methylase MTH1